MRAVVLYESMFGNTRDVALAIGEGLLEHVEVEVVEVGKASPSPQVDLLVVGGPTHAFGLSRATTRQDAAKQIGSAPVSAGIGIREWLSEADSASPGMAAAAFDTKIDKPVPGSAAHAAEKRLHRLGYGIVADAETFRVTAVAGPLRVGELERARAWGASLGAAVTSQDARLSSR